MEQQSKYGKLQDNLTDIKKGMETMRQNLSNTAKELEKLKQEIEKNGLTDELRNKASVLFSGISKIDIK